MNIQIYPLQPDDEEAAKTIMEWRNDPHTLSMFYNHVPKKWPSFFSEYQNEYFNDQKMKPCFAKNGEGIVAFLRSSEYKNSPFPGLTYDIDINIDPKQRGKGFASNILRTFSEYIFNSGIDQIIAEVKKINVVSIKSFQSAGFSIFDEQIKNAYGRLHEIQRLVKRKNEKK
jgi:RimJ/RimL family protein N-acetyltransferase